MEVLNGRDHLEDISLGKSVWLIEIDLVETGLLLFVVRTIEFLVFWLERNFLTIQFITLS